MNLKISIVVADDHPLLLKGLIQELKDYGYNILGGFTDGIKTFEAIVHQNPAIAILDIQMPFLTGFEVIQKCRESKVDTKFIILSSHSEEGYIIKAKELNISGYILKDEDFNELNKCIQRVNRGETYFSKEFHDVFNSEISPQLHKISLLSPSERTILRHVGQGKSSSEISKLLSISGRTVEKHRSNIISKLGLPSNIDALVNWVRAHKDLFAKL